MSNPAFLQAQSKVFQQAQSKVRGPDGIGPLLNSFSYSSGWQSCLQFAPPGMLSTAFAVQNYLYWTLNLISDELLWNPGAGAMPSGYNFTLPGAVQPYQAKALGYFNAQNMFIPTNTGVPNVPRFQEPPSSYADGVDARNRLHFSTTFGYEVWGLDSIQSGTYSATMLGPSDATAASGTIKVYISDGTTDVQVNQYNLPTSGWLSGSSFTFSSSALLGGVKNFSVKFKYTSCSVNWSGMTWDLYDLTTSSIIASGTGVPSTSLNWSPGAGTGDTTDMLLTNSPTNKIDIFFSGTRTGP